MRPTLWYKALVRRLFVFVFLFVWAACATADALQADKLDGRRAAIDRAMNFLHDTTSADAKVAKYGSDLLWCFYTISHTARDRELSESAARMGRELARRWRKTHQHVPPNATASDIYQMVAGTYSADLLGVRDRRLKAELRKAALRFTALDFLGFDAMREPPPANDPSRYDTWSGALITTYFGDAYGVRLGARYRDVLRWMPSLRPYEGDDEDLQFDSFYAITHLIYTLNRYHEGRVAPSLLPKEFQVLRRKLDEAIDNEDPEMAGEALDCLKAGGFENDPQVLKGMQYLVSSQLDNGAWVEGEDDGYGAYHSAWTSIDGLRDYRYHGMVTKLPGK